MLTLVESGATNQTHLSHYPLSQNRSDTVGELLSVLKRST